MDYVANIGCPDLLLTHNGEDEWLGTAYDGWIPAPYSNAERLAEYKRLHAAEKYADKLNGYA